MFVLLTLNIQLPAGKAGERIHRKTSWKKEDKGKVGSVGESLLNENVVNDEGET